MRLIDADALIQDLKNHDIPFNADINEAIIVAPTVECFKDLEEELKKNAIEEFKKKLIDKLLNEEI